MRTIPMMDCDGAHGAPYYFVSELVACECENLGHGGIFGNISKYSSLDPDYPVAICDPTPRLGQVP